MNDHELDQALHLFRESGRAWSEHWMQQPPRERRPAPVRPVCWMGAVAATLVAASVLLSPSPNRARAERPFVAIPYVDPPAPYERVSVAQMELPLAALISAGFDMPGRDPSELVETEVLLGQDGRPRAVRLSPGRE